MRLLLAAKTATFTMALDEQSTVPETAFPDLEQKHVWISAYFSSRVLLSRQ